MYLKGKYGAAELLTAKS